MSEIDVSKCVHYKNKTCLHDYLTTDLEFDKAKCDNCPDCYYKQLQQLKAENRKLKQCLYEIEEIANAIVNGTHFTTDIEGHFKELTKQILQLIKQAKKGWE